MKLYGDGIHDDTLALQELLDGRGIVRIEKPGTYLVSKTLIIHSNTRLELSPGARLLSAPLSRCALMENEHFADHDGGYDENIEIIGGIWDGNCDEMGLDAVTELKNRLETPYRPYVFKGKLIRFAHVERIHLSRMTVRNPVSYGVQIAAVYGFVVRDIFFDYNRHFGTTDGIHINGPAYDGVIENLSGTTNDDLVSLTTYDEPHAEITLGDIENVVIRNLSARNGYSAIRLLAGENYAMRIFTLTAYTEITATMPLSWATTTIAPATLGLTISSLKMSAPPRATPLSGRTVAPIGISTLTDAPSFSLRNGRSAAV